MTRPSKLFRGIGEKYKAEIIAGIPAGEEIGIYGQGDWFDLCRGPHVPSTGKLKAFKLMKVAGAYWRGDSRNEMLQRIYGTAWPDEKSLKDYLHRIEEAEKRDHRRIGKELDLFHFQEEAPGAVFWHPRGWTLFQQLIDYMRDRQREAGYQEVNTPEIMDRELWVQSGHIEKFGENMYMTQTPDERVYAIKPMNCPGHVQVFNQGLKSYRDLPLRLCEFGKVHRYEPSGALHGLMRVRAFTQDDAHVFCTEEQITAESVAVTNLILGIYRDFGFDDIRIKFSDRPPQRVGSDAIWDRAEARPARGGRGRGPRNDSQSRARAPFTDRSSSSCCGTPSAGTGNAARCRWISTCRGASAPSFVGEDSQRRVPVMLHRAMFGSLERFCGILLEHHAGRLPLWLAPVQAVVLNITDRQARICHKRSGNAEKSGHSGRG